MAQKNNQHKAVKALILLLIILFSGISTVFAQTENPPPDYIPPATTTPDSGPSLPPADTTTPDGIEQASPPDSSSVGDLILKNLGIFGAQTGQANTDLRAIIANLIRVALSFLGIILVIMIIFAGAQWMFSGGDDEKVGRAKKTLISSIVGLVIILLAYSIVVFVVNTLSGQTNVSP